MILPAAKTEILHCKNPVGGRRAVGSRIIDCGLKGVPLNGVSNSQVRATKVLSAFDQEDTLFSPEFEQKCICVALLRKLDYLL